VNFKRIFALILITSITHDLSLAQEDSPDLRLEDRFHEIYEKYNSIPTSEENWQSALGKKNVYSYDI